MSIVGVRHRVSGWIDDAGDSALPVPDKLNALSARVNDSIGVDREGIACGIGHALETFLFVEHIGIAVLGRELKQGWVKEELVRGHSRIEQRVEIEEINDPRNIADGDQFI